MSAQGARRLATNIDPNKKVETAQRALRSKVVILLVEQLSASLTAESPPGRAPLPFSWPAERGGETKKHKRNHLSVLSTASPAARSS